MSANGSFHVSFYQSQTLKSLTPENDITRRIIVVLADNQKRHSSSIMY